LRTYLLLAIVLTIPFWLVGWFSGLELLPGLPVSGLATFVPALAAIVVAFMQERGAGVRRLLGSSFGLRGRAGLALTIGLLALPMVTLLLWSWQVATGRPVVIVLGPIQLVVLSVLFVVAAAGEEIGWTGFATRLFGERFGWLAGAVLLGLFWAAWHVPGLLQVERSLSWMAWWAVTAITMRIIMVWLFRLAGYGGLPAVLLHGISNVCWQAAPDAYDPMIQAILLTVLSAAIVILVRVPEQGPRHMRGVI